MCLFLFMFAREAVMPYMLPGRPLRIKWVMLFLVARQPVMLWPSVMASDTIRPSIVTCALNPDMGLAGFVPLAETTAA